MCFDTQYLSCATVTVWDITVLQSYCTCVFALTEASVAWTWWPLSQVLHLHHGPFSCTEMCLTLQPRWESACSLHQRCVWSHVVFVQSWQGLFIWPEVKKCPHALCLQFRPVTRHLRHTLSLVPAWPWNLWWHRVTDQQHELMQHAPLSQGA